MTRTFVLTNHKGGVGKSTSATTIALGIAGLLRQLNATNPRVLLIDTDSQSHATLVTIGRNDFDTTDSLYSVLMADRQNAAQTLLNCIVQSTWDTDLHVLPASPMLEGAERELMGIAGTPYRLADPLSRIANRYAAIVIDTRPSFSLMTEMGLIAATAAIVPVEPRYLETSYNGQVMALAFNDVVIGATIVGTVGGAYQDLDANAFMGSRQTAGKPRPIGNDAARVTKHSQRGEILVGSGQSVGTVVAGFTYSIMNVSLAKRSLAASVFHR